MSKGPERAKQRRFKRIHHSYLVKYRRADEEKATWDITPLRDLSLGGLQIISREPYAIGQIVEMELRLGASPDPIIVQGQVMWRRPREGVHEHGIRFVEMTANAAQMLERTVGFFQEGEEVDESVPPAEALVYAERRREPRAKLGLQIRFRRSWTKEEWSSARAENICAIGLSLKTDRPIPMGSALDLHISVPQATEPIELSGRVVWVCDNYKEGNVQLGLEITRASRASRNLLLRSLEAFLKLPDAS